MTWPRRAPGVRASDERGAVVLRAGDGRELCAVNETALAIWELCDGATTPDEIALAVAELCSVEPSEARRDVLQALSTLEADGAIRWDGATESAGSMGGSNAKDGRWSRSTT